MFSNLIGRTVLYQQKGRPKDKAPFTAIIAGVRSPDRVNLAIFDDRGRPIAEPPTDIPLIDFTAEEPDDGPYCCLVQLGQAKVTGDVIDRIKKLEDQLEELMTRPEPATPEPCSDPKPIPDLRPLEEPKV